MLWRVSYNDLILLDSAHFELQRALGGLDAVCGEAKMKVKSRVLRISRKSGKCDIHLGRVALKRTERFNYIGVWFATDGGTEREDCVTDRPAGAVMQLLERTGIRREAKLSIYRAVPFPTPRPLRRRGLNEKKKDGEKIEKSFWDRTYVKEIEPYKSHSNDHSSLLLSKIILQRVPQFKSNSANPSRL